jgi:hypothetical protein
MCAGVWDLMNVNDRKIVLLEGEYIFGTHISDAQTLTEGAELSIGRLINTSAN